MGQLCSASQMWRANVRCARDSEGAWCGGSSMMTSVALTSARGRARIAVSSAAHASPFTQRCDPYVGVSVECKVYAFVDCAAVISILMVRF
jgi:hypothetical protein